MNNGNSDSKVPFDPGWNDPPTFSYNTQQTTPNRPRNFLNKRVAFPLSGTVSNAAPPPTVNLPPISSIPQIPIQTIPITSTEDIDSESILKEVKGIMLQFLDDSSELGPKSNDIKRRIEVMEEMWTNKKLNKQIHILMKNLACALRDDQPNKADEIHRILMVDHVGAVSPWMPGVKQLIHHCIAKSELLALDTE